MEGCFSFSFIMGFSDLQSPSPAPPPSHLSSYLSVPGVHVTGGFVRLLRGRVLDVGRVSPENLAPGADYTRQTSGAGEDGERYYRFPSRNLSGSEPVLGRVQMRQSVTALSSIHGVGVLADTQQIRGFTRLLHETRVVGEGSG